MLKLSFSKSIFICLCVYNISGYAGVIEVGQTYAIIEHDALEEIQTRASEVDWPKELSTRTIAWSARDGYPIPRALEDKKRFYKPLHTVKNPVTDGLGNVIYPLGYRFNVLDYITLPYRVVVIDESDIEWVVNKLKPTDMLILTSGDFEKTAIELQRPTFILDESVKARLGIKAVPTIIEQSANSFIINEYFVEVDPQ